MLKKEQLELEIEIGRERCMWFINLELPCFARVQFFRCKKGHVV